MSSKHPFPLHHIARFALIALLGPAVINGCRSDPTQKGKPLTIIAGETAMYQGPDRLSSKVTTLSYGQQVLALPKKLSNVGSDWIEVRLDKNRSGFVRGSTLGTPEMMATFEQLKQSIEGMEPQASGLTVAPTFLRLEPGREGKAVEKLPMGTRFEMFQRLATLPPRPTGSLTYETPRKEIWYKVRLADNRVGYIFTKNFKLEPPSEILNYIRSKKVIAWLKLKTVTGEKFGQADEYLVAYATPNTDFGADFDRMEAYHWDGEGYQTAFVLKSLRGILPIRVIRQGEEIYFEITELEPDDAKQVTVHRYLYAFPYKKMGSTPLKWELGLH